ncbi:homoserine kinase [Georgenia halophila]|uniref:Homoserine kinase n=1 Tax=Georgenia halophila TaxID=620889 RepID=A0ABP8KUS6_9MICO
MQIAHEHVRVRVPATSANLGPGFDAFGLALGVWDDLTVRAVAGPTRVVVEGEGNGNLPDGEGHLVVKAVRSGLEMAGAPQAGLELLCRNAIPHGRGMGSSAAAVVAGLIAARGLISDPAALDDATVLALATELEGHPDNAAPALLGGATTAWVDDEGPHAVEVPLAPGLRPTVLVPDARLTTSSARRVLPAQVPHADAAHNVARAALLVLALGGRMDLLLAGTEDRLHQGYRSDVMRPTAEAVRALREAGWPAVVSGAGPSVLVLERLDRPTAETLSRHGWRVLDPGVAAEGAHLVSP